MVLTARLLYLPSLGPFRFTWNYLNDSLFPVLVVYILISENPAVGQSTAPASTTLFLEQLRN